MTGLGEGMALQIWYSNSTNTVSACTAYCCKNAHRVYACRSRRTAWCCVFATGSVYRSSTV